MIAELDDLTYQPPRLPLFESSRYMTRPQQRAMWARGWRSVLPTLPMMAEHFDRYDDILAAFARQVSNGFAITPVEAVPDNSLDNHPPVMLGRNVRPYPAATVGERRQARIAEKAARLQAEYEVQQRASQKKREKVADEEWRAEEARRERAVELPFTDPHMVSWYFMLAAHSGHDNALRWVTDYIEKTKAAA